MRDPTLIARRGPAPHVILDRDEATYVLAYLMAGADGRVSTDEELAIDQKMAARDVNISAQRLRELHAFAAGAVDNTDHALSAISDVLGDEPERTRALLLATDIIWADSEIDPGEMTSILELADALDLSRGEISTMLDARTA